PEDLHRVWDQPDCKDVPCNTEVMFLPRLSTDAYLHPCQKHQGKREKGGCDDEKAAAIRVLDMTVINRSNDTLWGALGSNYVHFSFLHEYISLATGCVVGRYNQFSNNLHVYVST